jgi:polysaccharide export outer membrane protein
MSSKICATFRKASKNQSIKLSLLAWLFLGLAFSAMAIAADSSTADAQAQGGKYVLGPGDNITIRATDVDELDGKTSTIDLRGYVDLPLLGSVKVTGNSVEQLQAKLTEQLGKYVKSPQVTVTVADYRSQPVSVFGAVNDPGVYSLTGENTLVQVISKAKGLRNDAGAKIKITRGKEFGPIPLASAKVDPATGFSTAEVDVKSLLAASNPQDNIVLKPTDVVSVPKADVVYVIGAVHKAGGFVLDTHQDMSVLQAISMAEGLDKTSAPKSAKIIRRGTSSERKEIPVNIKNILSGKDPDVALLANDILFVPNSGMKSAALRGLEAALQTGTGIAIFH